MAKINICKWCKKEYEYIPHQSGRFFCSRKCCDLNSHEKQVKLCQICRNKFYSRIENKKFCSDKCRIENLKNKRLKTNCSQCKKEIFLTVSSFLLSKEHFCSKICLNKWKSHHYSGKNNPNWHGGKKIKICETCKKSYKVINARLNSKFCSSRCFGIWISKNNHHFNGHKTGYRNDLNKFFRSRWEANFARYLNYMDIKWEYEPKTFFFQNEKRGVNCYTPDFYLKQFDTYIEIKGYLDSKSKSKLKKMELYYPDINVYLFIGKDYYNIEREFGWKIPYWEWKDENETKKMLVYNYVIKKIPYIVKIANIDKTLILKIPKYKFPDVIINSYNKAKINAKKRKKIPLVVFTNGKKKNTLIMCEINNLKKIAKFIGE